MKYLIPLFFAVFFVGFSAEAQRGSQTPVGGLSYAPDSDYVIYSQFYRGRNGVPLWRHKDSINWTGNFTPQSIIFAAGNGTLTENNNNLRFDGFAIRQGNNSTANALPLPSLTRVFFQSDGINAIGRRSNFGFTNYSEINSNFNSIDKMASSIYSRARFSGSGTIFSAAAFSPLVASDIIYGHGYNAYKSATTANSIATYVLVDSMNGLEPRLSYNISSGSIVSPGNPRFDTGLDKIFSLSGFTRNITLHNYDGSSRDNSATYTPQRPLYTDVNGSLLMAPLDSFEVHNPATTAAASLYSTLNSIYSATTTGVNFYNSNGTLTGNRTLTGGGNNLTLVSMGNITATGAGSATYRFNLYPYSSLPLLLEQTSAGDTAHLQLQASLGRAILRATQDIYLQAANSVFVSTLESSSTGIVSARPTGELIRREEAFFNAYFTSDTITVAASETEINSTFVDAVSQSFTISGDSIIYTGTDTAYFDIGYYTEAEVLESATGTYLLELSCYKNGIKVFPSEAWNRVYFTAGETEPIQGITKRFITQLVTGDVLNIRQNGTTGIDAALHNFSFTGQKLQ